MKHVIIGNGPAGIIAAETIRKLDRDAAISIFGDEPGPPYSRMALPYFLNGKIDEAGTYLRKTADYYESRRIELFRNRVTAIDPARQSIKTEAGKDVHYDRLLIATGSSPVTPPVPGIDAPGIHSCWTLEDARNIVAKSGKGAAAVLIGAGFIGSIILEALVDRFAKVTVVELEDRMVPRMLDQYAGNLIKQWCEKKGVTVFTSTKVEAIEKQAAGLKINLDSGAVMHADLVITATGVRPNTAVLAGSGIATDTGVLVNEYLQTGCTGIYAAGDVCQGSDFSTGGYSVQAIQPTAVDHGRLAAMNMSDRRIRHQGGINMNVLDTLGLISTSYGLWNGIDGGSSVTLEDADRYRYMNLQFEEDVLIGAQTLGLTEHIGIIRGLIQTRLRLGRWQGRLLKDPTCLVEAWIGCTQAVGNNAGIL